MHGYVRKIVHNSYDDMFVSNKHSQEWSAGLLVSKTYDIGMSTSQPFKPWGAGMVCPVWGSCKIRLIWEVLTVQPLRLYLNKNSNTTWDLGSGTSDQLWGVWFVQGSFTIHQATSQDPRLKMIGQWNPWHAMIGSKNGPRILGRMQVPMPLPVPYFWNYYRNQMESCPATLSSLRVRANCSGCWALLSTTWIQVAQTPKLRWWKRFKCIHDLHCCYIHWEHVN